MLRIKRRFPALRQSFILHVATRCHAGVTRFPAMGLINPSQTLRSLLRPVEIRILFLSNLNYYGCVFLNSFSFSAVADQGPLTCFGKAAQQLWKTTLITKKHSIDI